jgi:signal transduction histidine kinase/DNA-binding NarL/FixJ family response regulator
MSLFNSEITPSQSGIPLALRGVSEQRRPDREVSPVAGLEGNAGTVPNIWVAKMIRAAGAVVIITSLLSIIERDLLTSTIAQWGLASDVISLLIAGFVFVCASWLSTRHWEPVLLAACSLLLVNYAISALETKQTVPLLTVVVLMAVGTGAMMPWVTAWQAVFNAICLSTWALITYLVPDAPRNLIDNWIMVVAAAALGQFSSHVHREFAADRARSQRRLQESEAVALAGSRAKSEFLSSMSHEIRTPMNAVLGMAELLSETELSGEQRRYLDIMVANGNGLLELINSILDMARIESGRLQIEKAEFDLTDLIDTAISTLGVRAHGKGLKLAARIAPGVPRRLFGDPLRLRQILINLIGNAIKFTEVGEITVKVFNDPGGSEPGSLRFIVADTGIGIARDKVDSIFSSFTQADSSTTRKYGGSGLGLAIAQRLVGLMGGRIWLESEVGKGSNFSFTAQFGLAPRVVSSGADTVLSLAGYRVLVVDDHQINRLIVREMISDCGAEVSEAESGEEALAAVCESRDAGQPYRIILLDMRMPGMDGLEVISRIRAETLPVKPVILMLSSDDLKPELARLKELGVSVYLLKPVTRKQLFEAIHRALEEANQDKANAMSERQTPEPATEQAADVRLYVVRTYWTSWQRN